MTIRRLKELLSEFDDDDRIILDRGDTTKATSENEILCAYKVKGNTDKEWAPVVILQTRDDFDVGEELLATMMNASLSWMDPDAEVIYEGDLLYLLLETGYVLDDFKLIDTDAYEWALDIAEEYGLV